MNEWLEVSGAKSFSPCSSASFLPISKAVREESYEAFMTEFVAVMQLPFMRYALLAGLCVAVMGGVLGVFVVQRGLSFLGDGLAHSAFGGVALGLLVGVSQPLWVALPFTLATALGIAWVRERTALSSDTTIGVFFCHLGGVGGALYLLEAHLHYRRLALALRLDFGRRARGAVDHPQRHACERDARFNPLEPPRLRHL